MKLTNRKGRLFEYESLENFYAMVLNTWRGEYPDGKIDYMRFLMDWTNNYNECLRKLNYLMSALCYCVNREECFKAKDFIKAFNRIYARFHETDSHRQDHS